MKKIFFYIVLLCIVFLIFKFFNKEGTNIGSLKHRELEFNELPKNVQKQLTNTLNGTATVKEENGFIILNKELSYECKIVKTGPWTNYSILKNLSTGKEYRIPRDASHPYIVYENRLYIPKAYNIFMLEIIYSVKYDEYILKE